jgi:DNA repair protein RecO (recombination protein O)
VQEKSFSTEAIILSRKNFGEADRLLTIFTKYYGKRRVLAKGVRRPISRKRGSLEIFSYVKIFLAKGKNIDIVTEAELINRFGGWRKDLIKVGVAYHLVEVVERLTAENQEHKEIFKLLVNSFEKLTSLGYWEIYPFVQSFKVKVLEELGFLERHRPTTKNLDSYIEELVGCSLQTKKFLKTLA